MKTQRLSLFSIILFCLFSCDKKECCTNIDIDINLKGLNQQGQNLLAVPAVYSRSNIEIYHVINGQAQLFDQPNLDADSQGRPYTCEKFGLTERSNQISLL